MQTKTINWKDIYNKIPCSTAGKIVNLIVIGVLITALLIGGWETFKKTCLIISLLWVVNAGSYLIRSGYRDPDNTYSEYTIINIITLGLCWITIHFFNDLGAWGYVILIIIAILWFLISD